ncbi:MAG: glycosyltransferase [Desulfuromonadales bacterium]|nr:glycosyltransferase [Desulfuromonadales bacterium]
MRIVHILSTLERRGAQAFARELVNGLSAQADIAQEMLVLFPGEDAIDMAATGVPIHSLSARKGPARLLALAGMLRRIQPDIVLAHGGTPQKYAVLARCGRSRPAIVYRKIGLVDPWLERDRRLKLVFLSWLTRRTDAISTVGEATRTEAIRLFGADPQRVRVIYRGVAAERFVVPPAVREHTRQALAIAPAARVMIAVGALGWEKNQAAMLRILNRIRREIPDVVLLLVGDGPERSALERLADKLGVANAVRFLGTRTDVPELLAAADLFLLTSWTEGVPGVLIEAGLAGLPCATWAVAGTGEVVQDGISGRVTPMKDEAALAKAAIELLIDPARARAMGEAGRRFCRERFAVQRCVAEHLRLFADVLSTYEP